MDGIKIAEEITWQIRKLRDLREGARTFHESMHPLKKNTNPYKGLVTSPKTHALQLAITLGPNFLHMNFEVSNHNNTG
jgi:hypothetical protein